MTKIFKNEKSGKLRKKNPSYIVCAACRENGVTLAGARHFDSVMLSQVKAIHMGELGRFARAEQGFIDQFGDFHTREEALEIAKKNKQLYRNPDAKKILFSEDLY